MQIFVKAKKMALVRVYMQGLNFADMLTILNFSKTLTNQT
jgi:hypothetical protein